VESVRQAGLRTYPYHVYVPSFGEWGYVIGSFEEWRAPAQLPAGLRFLSTTNVNELFVFPVDMQRVPAEPNRLNSQVLVRYYEEEWKDVAH
jgi:spermidine synthase